MWRNFTKRAEHAADFVNIIHFYANFRYNACISVNLHRFFVFHSVFLQKRSNGNDNGKFSDHFDAEQTTRKRNGVCKTFFSHNTTRHPDNAMRLAVWRPFLIFHKNFCIIYIRSKGKDKLFRNKNYEKKEILYEHFTKSSKGFFI